MEKSLELGMHPENSGVYFEIRCKTPLCPVQNKKIYSFIGAIGNFDYFEEYESLACYKCAKKNIGVSNIGFLCSKWVYQGDLEDGDLITSNVNYSLGYEVCQDIKKKNWKWLRFKVETINTQEIEKLRSAFNKSFDFDINPSEFQTNPVQTAQRFNEKNRQNLKKEIERKRDIIHYLKKNLKNQQKIIKKLSRKKNNDLNQNNVKNEE
jgi:hypothetical protein